MTIKSAAEWFVYYCDANFQNRRLTGESIFCFNRFSLFDFGLLNSGNDWWHFALCTLISYFVAGFGKLQEVSNLAWVKWHDKVKKYVLAVNMKLFTTFVVFS